MLVLLLSLALLVAVLPDVSVADCRDDKCSYLSGEFLAINEPIIVRIFQAIPDQITVGVADPWEPAAGGAWPGPPSPAA